MPAHLQAELISKITRTVQNFPRDPTYESARKARLRLPIKNGLGWANSKTQTLETELTTLSKGVCGDTRLAVH